MIVLSPQQNNPWNKKEYADRPTLFWGGQGTLNKTTSNNEDQLGTW